MTMSPPFSTSTDAEGAPAGPDAGATYLAADALAAAGNRRGAVALLRRLLAHDPHLAHAHALMGFHLYVLGDAAAAEAAGRSALAIDPASALAHRALGLVLGLSMLRRPKALVHLREAVRLAPEVAVHHLDLGALLTAMTHRREARACLERACALAPADASILASAARSMLVLRRRKEAQAMAARALAARPFDADVLAMAARLHLRAGRYAAARDDARAALSIKADHVEAGAVLAEADMRRRPAFALWGAIRRWDDLSWPWFVLVIPFVMSGLIGIIALMTWLEVPKWLVAGAFAAVGLWVACGTEVFEHRAGEARRPVKLDRRF